MLTLWHEGEMQNALRFERDSSGQYPINMLEHCEEITKNACDSNDAKSIWQEKLNETINPPQGEVRIAWPGTWMFQKLDG